MAPRLLRYAADEIVPLPLNKRHAFAAGHALVAYRSGAIYSFIPKNGCTTLRLSLAIANGCIAGAGAGDWTWIHNNNRTFRADLRDLATAPFTFVILRCPHARLASVFLDKFVSRRPEFWRLHAADRDRLDPETLTFRDVVALLDDPEILDLDMHWRPQADFLVYAEYDLWVPLERFGAAIGRIEKGAKLPIVDARPLAGHGTDGLEKLDGAFADTPLHELARLRRDGKVPHHAALYDAGLATSVGRIYEGDGLLYRERFGPDDMLFPQTFEQAGQAT